LRRHAGSRRPLPMRPMRMRPCRPSQRRHETTATARPPSSPLHNTPPVHCCPNSNKLSLVIHCLRRPSMNRPLMDGRCEVRSSLRRRRRRRVFNLPIDSSAAHIVGCSARRPVARPACGPGFSSGTAALGAAGSCVVLACPRSTRRPIQIGAAEPRRRSGPARLGCGRPGKTWKRRTDVCISIRLDTLCAKFAQSAPSTDAHARTGRTAGPARLGPPSSHMTLMID
jgi:hypothetical protein